MKYRLTYKCPKCGGRPSESCYGLTGLTMIFCCRMMGAKPSRPEAIAAWNTLAESAWQRKLTTSTVGRPSDSPPDTSLG